MLNEQDTLYYLRLAKQGDNGAKETLLEHNTSLLKSILKRYLNKGVEYDDLYQLSCIGFLKAIAGFDESFGVRFSTYAVPMIIGEIRRYLRDNNSIRVSRSLRDNAYRAIYAKEAFIRENNREPTIEELSAASGIAKEDIVNAMDAVQTPVSLYEPVYSEGGDALYIMDQVSDKKNREENWIEEISLKEAMKRLPERENNIIRLRYFQGKTQMEVAEEINISQAQVSRLEKNALKNMKNYLSDPTSRKAH